MSKMVVVCLFVFLLMNVYSQQNCNSTIIPTQSSNIICDNTCNYCNITCDSINQCSNANVFSGAINTNVNCFGEGSCQSMTIYAGIDAGHGTIIQPLNGLSADNFNRNSYDSITIICSGKTSCLGLKAYINGNYINGGLLNADSGGLDGFKDGYLQVSILETQIFNLFCAIDTKNCNGNIRYQCDNGNCQCNGVTRGLLDGCSPLTGRFLMLSRSPTLATIAPTAFGETPSPTIFDACNQPNQPIRPSNENIIICDNNCADCEIICDTTNQCSNKEIYSGASNTIITCIGENSCLRTQMYIGNTGIYPPNYNHNNFQRTQYQSVNIICTGKTGCASSTVVINGEFTNPLTLNADSGGQDSFKDAKLDVAIYPGQSFNLNCGSENANCAGAEYICRGGGMCLCNQNSQTLDTGCSLLLNGVISEKTRAPSTSPTLLPTINPTKSSNNPTSSPSLVTRAPVAGPTGKPSFAPSITPTDITPSPTIATPNPTVNPTNMPTVSPTNMPTPVTINPTKSTSIPTMLTNNPTLQPTLSSQQPSIPPTTSPTKSSNAPTTPSVSPTNASQQPSISPTITPTTGPSTTPSVSPTNQPTELPSISPTYPTANPTLSSISPTKFTLTPSNTPSNSPSITPTNTPTNNPTKITVFPTKSSNSPTKVTESPTLRPTSSPSITRNPTESTPNPTPATNEPSVSPTNVPTSNPTIDPTSNPSASPTTKLPSISPTYNPTLKPTSMNPSTFPTTSPTIKPTDVTLDPTISPVTTPPTSSPLTPSPTSSPTTQMITPTVYPTTRSIILTSLDRANSSSKFQVTIVIFTSISLIICFAIGIYYVRNNIKKRENNANAEINELQAAMPKDITEMYSNSNINIKKDGDNTNATNITTKKSSESNDFEIKYENGTTKSKSDSVITKLGAQMSPVFKTDILTSEQQ